MTPRAILITGRPGIGKTTLIRKLLVQIKATNVAGFYTEEIREGGSRQGFRLRSLAGAEGILAHVRITGPYAVGRYGVDVEGFEAFLGAIPFGDAGLVVIDEIGKMECLSPLFRRLMCGLLEAGTPLIATIAKKGSPFMDEIKRTPGVRLLVITEASRDSVLGEAARLVRAVPEDGGDEQSRS
jgi:nucleoside-triphosphatase